MRSNNVVIDVELPVADEALAKEILKLASNGLVSWQELVKLYRGKCSLYRLRKVLLTLLDSRRLVKFHCELSITKYYH